MKLSVLVCTYQRHKLLRQALESLIVTSTDRPDEIVVVNGGDVQADQVVEELMNPNGVVFKLIKTKNKNLAASRNVGLKQCTGDIVAMTDDDAQVFPDWAVQMKRAHHDHPEAGAVGGPVLGSNTDSLVGKVADVITFPSWPTARTVRTLPGVNISYKREVLEKIGEQDETLFRGEDVDFNWRVIQLGYEIYYDPAIKVYHYHRPTVRGFLNQHYMYGRAYYLVRRKWPDMYAIYPRKLRRPKDLLKALNCLALPFYQPFISSRKLNRVGDRLLALPLLWLAGMAWEAGMLVQYLRERFS